MKFFIGALHFFIGGKKLFVGGLKLFIACLKLFYGGLKLFIACLKLFYGGLEIFAGELKVVFKRCDKVFHVFDFTGARDIDCFGGRAPAFFIFVFYNGFEIYVIMFGFTFFVADAVNEYIDIVNFAGKSFYSLV